MAGIIKNGDDFLHIKLAAPARRALAGAGINSLEQLSKLREDELSRLHGIGPDALKKIREAMDEQGLSYSKDK